MSSLVDTTPAPPSSSSKRATSSASEPIEGHKCFMCGIVCTDAGDLDTHVIRCAKGQLSSARRREDAAASGTTGHITSEPGHVGVTNGGPLREQQDVVSEPPSTVPSHDVSFEAPPRRLSQHSAPDDHLNISQHGTNGELHEVSRGVSDGLLPHDVVVTTVVRTDDQDHNEDVGSPNVSTMDQTPTSHPPSANASPRPRRRRAHTAHAEVEEDAAAAERRRRRTVMEEQLLSLESMQQANQERLRRQAQGAQPTTPQLSLEGGGANESFTSPTLSSPHLTGTPVTSSSATTTAGGGRMVIPPKASKYLPQHEIAVLSSSGLSSGGVGPGGEVSPNAFLRHHTTVVWSDKYDTMEGSPSPTKDQLTRSPVLGSRQKDTSGLRGSLERSSSAVVMPSDAPRRSTIAPNMLPPSPFHASPPGGATRGGATGAAGAAVAQHHRDPMVRVANTSPLPHRAPFRVTGRSVTTAQTTASVAKQQTRTSSSDARSRVATSSPQPVARRSSTVAGQKRNTLPPSHQGHHGHQDVVPPSLNSSVEGPRTEQPMAPMPRAATTVRQRTQPITAISTSKIQMLLPPSRKVPTTADSLSSSLRVGASAGGGSSSGASHATSAAHINSKGTLSATTATHGAVRKTAPTAPSSLNVSGTAGSSGYGSRQLVKKTGTAAEKIAALSNAAHVSSAAQHHAAKAPTTSSGAGGTVLTVSCGNVAIGGAVPQPHHSTLRAPNPGRKSLHSATLHSSMAAAASPPHARGVVPPPPPLRQPSSSIGRHNNTPPGGRLGSPPPRATDTSTGSSLAAVVTFCTQCGNRYVEGAKFCAFCGHRREDPVTPVSTLTAAERKRDHVSSSPSAAQPSETLVVSLPREDISEPPQAISTN